MKGRREEGRAGFGRSIPSPTLGKSQGKGSVDAYWNNEINSTLHVSFDI
jgi:hypothetical protein